jgi:SOUL heme-binding protein
VTGTADGSTVRYQWRQPLPLPDRHDRAGHAAGRPGKIAMTAPVLQQAADQPGRYLVQFVMPSHLTAETLPVPHAARVRTREIPRGSRRRHGAAGMAQMRGWMESQPGCLGVDPPLLAEDRPARRASARGVAGCGLSPSAASSAAPAAAARARTFLMCGSVRFAFGGALPASLTVGAIRALPGLQCCE